ncbi:MAG: PilW family protein [Betaproteobacteria bacterium]|nr:PilW family protein [Betaproteobacteria bacterium]MDE2002275.1 PilW family protein [Betaproteobacteria bacterium]MDE2209810.1 PilW family protein [Betaproteobacteria bacterium]MDE2358899.1 PilW family protein [Betaproteobacteria bacterium]
MQSPRATGSARRRQTGLTLIDALVGIAIILVATVAVHHAFVALGQLRRSVSTAADAEQTASFAASLLAIAAENAGAGIAASTRWLDSCPASPAITATPRPVVALVTDSGRVDRPDSLVVRQALQSRLAAPAAFAAAAPAGASFRVQSPDGFVVGDRVVAISRAGSCATAEVTGVTAVAPGVIDIAHTPVGVDLPVTSLLMNLGPARRAPMLRFDVASGVLRSTDMLNGDAPTPLVSNIVNLKLQYGIDRDGDGALDDWVGASVADGLDAASMLSAPRALLERIVALRIGVIARSEESDPQASGDFRWVLFDCELPDRSTCPGRLEGTISGSAAGSYRYGTREMIVPLRNVLWNRDP